MLPLLQEYRINHPRFKEHLGIALIMALMAPACALVLFRSIGWWNPWLWASCALGLALAINIISIVKLHRSPRGMTEYSKQLIRRSPEWFPYYFVVIQSSIASLIIMFLWFCTASFIIHVPSYVHIALVILALLIPARRFIWANISYTSKPLYEKWDEILHGIWHILFSIFLARTIIGLTISDMSDLSLDNIAWQIIVWTPALLYMLYVSITTIRHLIRVKMSLVHRSENKTRISRDVVDRF